MLTLQIIVLLLLISLNGLLAMAEIAVVSSRKARLQRMADKGSAGAKYALKLANDPSTFLSTIQVGITLVGIITGAFSGAVFSQYLDAYLKDVPLIGIYSEFLSFTIVVVLITYFSIVLGELVPKRVALNNPEGIAAIIGQPMSWFSKAVRPAVKVLSFTTDLILGIFGMKHAPEETISEEEIRVVINQAANAGVLEEAEQDIINQIFQLGDKKARDIMTPQSEVEWLDSNDNKTAILEIIHSSRHSHYPVYEKEKENILGFIHVKDILEHWTTRKGGEFKDYIQKPLYILETTKILTVLELFRQHNTHIALIVDEYGSIEGLVTVNDIFEAIVGEVPDIDEANDPHVTRRDKNSWYVDGILSIDEFKERFDIQTMWREDEEEYQSVGGFVMNYLDTIPKPGDSFSWNGYSYEVVDMDGNRVDKILLTKLPEDEKIQKKTDSAN